MKPRLVLLASYPKSGNTWLRLVLSSLCRGGQAVSINELALGSYGNRRVLFDLYSPWPASDLDDAELDLLWPDVYHQFNRAGAELEYLKVHTGAWINRRGHPVFPPECIRSVLHLVRHPFDVALSLAHHGGLSLEEAVRRMTAPGLTAARQNDGMASIVPERWGSWHEHLISWLAARETHRVLTVRYEDLLQDPQAGFALLARHAGLVFSEGQLQQALQHTRFERLQAEEAASGFRERPASSARFFRQGIVGAGRRHLSRPLRGLLLQQCAPLMQQLGYGEEGEILPYPC